MSLTKHQTAIIKQAQLRGGKITKKEVVALFGHWHYCNAEKHIGDTLSRMVKARLLIRESPGVFSIGKGKKGKPATIAENQQKLF